MKMRKLLAVVLAVVLAISAMAISVFADETYTIPMYNYSSTTTSTTTYTITVPLYGLYGYLVAGDTITLNLPTSLVSDDDGDGVPDYDLPVSYTLTIGGVEVALQGTADYDTVNGTDVSAAYGTYSQDVTVGYAAQNYQLVSWAGFEAFAMVPQSTSVSASTTMTITATVDWSSVGSDVTAESWEAMATWWPVWGMYYGQQVIVSVDSATQGVSDIYGYSLSVSKSTGSSSSSNNVVIIADTTVDDDSLTEASTTNTLLYWDHTLSNRVILMTAASTEGATATLEVKLADSIYGYAVYTLTTTAEAASTSDVYSSTYSANSSLWYTSGTSALYNAVADTDTMAGETRDTLTFDVPVSALYNSTYGLYNGTMFITQLLTASSANSSLLATKYYTNSYDTDNDNTADSFTLEATEVNLIVTIPTDDDDSDVVADEPVEDTNSGDEEDGEDIDVGDDAEEPAETNPTTGIVLALVPMAVAAAAAVASKRR